MAIDTQHRRGSPCLGPQKREGKKQVSKSKAVCAAYARPLGPYPPARKQEGAHRAERVLFDLEENRLESKHPFPRRQLERERLGLPNDVRSNV